MNWQSVLRPNPVFDSSLADYVSAEEHVEHAVHAQLVAAYHKLKASAYRARSSGRIRQATIYEAKADKLASKIERLER